MHLLTFLKAAVGSRHPDAAVELITGLYGDLDGTLALAAETGADTALVVEWTDVDSRLGLRSAGGWGPSVERDIIESSRAQFARLLDRIAALAVKVPVALAGPSLAVRLFGHTTGWHLGAVQAELQLLAARFLADASRVDNVVVLNPSWLAEASPSGGRLDAKLELAAGFPYSLAHASVLAEQLARLLYPPAAKKGLITDLDDTLWAGIVGEVGVGSVKWRLDDHAHGHGLYQQQLKQLAEMGVLLGVVTKNEPAVVEEALQLPGLYISKDAFYPVRAGWGQKSQSVGEVLQAWNVGPESVVFVDDSPMELDEVQRAFPAITCLQFPAKHPGQLVELLARVRDLFGKREIQAEDALRQASIRANADFAAAATVSGDYLGSLGGRLSMDLRKGSHGRRALELINKTNQFNLNGLRVSDGEWRQLLEAPDSVVATVAYEDKFGPLGVIGVVVGTLTDATLAISSWVLSCRAFSRRIEHHTLAYLFARTAAARITLAYAPTERNQPLQAFLASLGLGTDMQGALSLGRDEFEVAVGALPHVVLPDLPG